jgi:hypothetical protein
MQPDVQIKCFYIYGNQINLIYWYFFIPFVCKINYRCHYNEIMQGYTLSTHAIFASYSSNLCPKVRRDIFHTILREILFFYVVLKSAHSGV